MPGQQDLWPWLQSIMQNQGAGQPMNPNAIPAAAPQAMPGSGVNGMPAMTQGGPSMGYAAGDEPGVWNMRHGMPQSPDFSGLLRYASGSPGGPGPGPGGVGSAGNDSGFNNPLAAAATAPVAPMMPLRTSTYPSWPTPGSGGSSGMPAPQTYPHMPWPDTDAPAGSPSATPRPVDSGAKGPLASPTNTATPMKRTAGAPNLGYYQPSNRFIGIAQPNASPQNSMRAGPQATALNLGGLFGGRGQQPAANPANVPAANAQPVSASAPNAYPGDAGWNVDARGNPIPDTSSADPTQMSPAALAGAVSKPNWWQQFGRPDMSPGQLASAVRKPNWYRNM